MAAAKKVIIDPGHGGADPGAVFEGRQEKDDNLRLAFDLGNALERRGIQVEYTRVSDVYDSPGEKAAIANRSDADLFVSLHRNAMPVPGTASGVESLVYENSGTRAALAANIDAALAGIGWTDLGVKERPGLIVLRQTKMPAVLVEVGFLDNAEDNAFLDSHFAATADAIAEGILKTFEELEQTPSLGEGELPGFYMVQTGAYRNRQNAEKELGELQNLGFPAFLVAKNGLFHVRAGAFRNLDYAAAMERRLRELGYTTVIVRT